MRWVPTDEAQKAINLIVSMCIDCRMGQGVDASATFTANLRMIADHIDGLLE